MYISDGFVFFVAHDGHLFVRATLAAAEGRIDKMGGGEEARSPGARLEDDDFSPFVEFE